MIQEKIHKIRSEIAVIARQCDRDPSTISLVAVSKRVPVEIMREAHKAGQLVFGENYIQEAAEKHAQLNDDVRLHFIGHLQSNKAKIAAKLFTMIETIDRFKIAATLDRHLKMHNRTLDILVQVNIGHETSKAGVRPEEAESLIQQIKELNSINVRGLMIMPPFFEDPEMVRPYFKKARLLLQELQAKGLVGSEKDAELSMGMSHDFHVAIEEGATIIRVGTAIFGPRPVTRSLLTKQ